MTTPLAASNDRVKRLRRLTTQRKARSRERAFVVDGPTLVDEALSAMANGGPSVEAVYVGPDGDPVIERAAEAVGVPVNVVATGVLDAVLDPVNPRPVVAIVARQQQMIVDLRTDRLVLCLVEARDPGNVGTLIRSAEAAGAAGIVLAGESVDPTNPKGVRASAGSILRLPVVEIADVDDAIAELRAGGRRLVATIAGTEAIPYDQVRLVDAAVLLGNEAHGLREAVVAGADVTTTIPLAGPTESLNLAVAGSLFCFEALRQTGGSPMSTSLR